MHMHVAKQHTSTSSMSSGRMATATARGSQAIHPVRCSLCSCSMLALEIAATKRALSVSLRIQGKKVPQGIACAIVHSQDISVCRDLAL